MKQASLLLLAVSSVLAACGSNEDVDPGKTPPQDPAGNPCDLNSGFPGDDVCIPPPPAGEGVHIHVGPANYHDPTELEPYLIPAGREEAKCFIVRIPEGGFYYLRQQNRMQPGSHHM